MVYFLAFIAAVILFSGAFFIGWYLSYSECLLYLKNYGYDPVECVKFSIIVLKPALKRYKQACAEKLGMQNKSEKFKF